MTNFNYMAPAELFPRARRIRRGIGYRRFDTAAEAIRYAVEQMPSALLEGTILETGEERIEGSGILDLYESERYPLTKK